MAYHLGATMEPHNFETYISVDVETAGPIPGEYAMLSIGACTVFDSSVSFYIELQPDKEKVQADALKVSGLKMDELKERGEPPKAGVQKFADWVAQHTLPANEAVFVAFNAPFDWMFVNHYFHRYLGHNPFGHSALDMKVYYMGLKGISWSETSMKAISRGYFGEISLTHHALQDAIDQAELFKMMLKEAKRRK